MWNLIPIDSFDGIDCFGGGSLTSQMLFGNWNVCFVSFVFCYYVIDFDLRV